MNNFLSAEIRLSFSGQAMEGVKVGQPSFFLWWSDEVMLFEEPTWFVCEKYVRRASSPSVHTWEATAYDLKTWFQYMQAKGRDWREATEADRRAFADDFSAAISPNGGAYDEQGINRRLSNVRKLYDYAAKHYGYIGDIGSAVETVQAANTPIDDDPLAHTRSASERTKQKDALLRKVGRKDKVRPLQVRQLIKLIKHLGPEATHRGDDTRRVRDRLIGDCGWVCGMRLADVVGLTTLKFLGIVVEPGEEHYDFPIIIEKSKGNVTRLVAVPGWLVLCIQEYIRTERAAAERAARKRTTALFLGHVGSKSVGQPLSRSAIQKMIALNCEQCGITQMKEVVDPDTGRRYTKSVAAHSFHDLRHDCAVLTYHAEKARGNPEPWKVVQLKLGHKSLKVTIDIYLAHVEIFGKKQGVVDMRSMVGLK